MRRTDTTTFNPKPGKRPVRNNPVKYLLGKILPSVFGMPIHLTAVLRDEFGRVKQTQHVYNTVTTAGKAAIMDQLLASPSLAKPGYMAIGTGTPSGTALGAELTRVAFTSKTRSTNVVTMQGDYAAGVGTGALIEAGVFDAASVGNMHLSATFSTINKAAADTLSIVWTWTGA